MDLDGDRALFSGKLNGIVALFFENEQPPQGLAGLLDWRFQGAISRCLKNGVVTGKAGECVYLPVTKNGHTYHLILAGAGRSILPGKRGPVPVDTLRVLHKNLSTLRLTQIGISRQDFGDVRDEYFAKHLKGVDLCAVL
jgi:hypothetical protein